MSLFRRSPLYPWPVHHYSQWDLETVRNVRAFVGRTHSHASIVTRRAFYARPFTVWSPQRLGFWMDLSYSKYPPTSLLLWLAAMERMYMRRARAERYIPLLRFWHKYQNEFFTPLTSDGLFFGAILFPILGLLFIGLIALGLSLIFMSISCATSGHSHSYCVQQEAHYHE